MRFSKKRKNYKKRKTYKKRNNLKKRKTFKQKRIYIKGGNPITNIQPYQNNTQLPNGPINMDQLNHNLETAKNILNSANQNYQLAKNAYNDPNIRTGFNQLKQGTINFGTGIMSGDPYKTIRSANDAYNAVNSLNNASKLYTGQITQMPQIN
jgi:hypothetical protein